MRAAGLDVRVHDDLFAQGTADVVWLREAGIRRWVVLMHDMRIRYNELEKRAVLGPVFGFQHHLSVADWR
jgi:hypothetical protein